MNHTAAHREQKTSTSPGWPGPVPSSRSSSDDFEVIQALGDRSEVLKAESVALDALKSALATGFLDKILTPQGDRLLQVVSNLGSLAAARDRVQTGEKTIGHVACGGPRPSIPTELYVVAA